MDPLLGRLLPPQGTAQRRTVLLLAAGVGALVLVGAIVLSSLSAGGSSAALPTVQVQLTPTPAATPLLVQVVGAVRRPGLVSLLPGARAVDAIAAAGGATDRADESGVNLAAPVADGQQLVVPTRGAAAPVASAGAPASGARISLGSATAEQLETLPRIGPALAARIIAYRAAHGGFRSVAELQQVGGIGPKTFAGLKDLVVP